MLAGRRVSTAAVIDIGFELVFKRPPPLDCPECEWELAKVASLVANPACTQASRKACWMAGEGPDWRRLTGMGPSVP